MALESGCNWLVVTWVRWGKWNGAAFLCRPDVAIHTIWRSWVQFKRGVLEGKGGCGRGELGCCGLKRNLDKLTTLAWSPLLSSGVNERFRCLARHQTSHTVPAVMMLDLWLLYISYSSLGIVKDIRFMCRLSWNLGASNSWNPQGLSRPVMGLLCQRIWSMKPTFWLRANYTFFYQIV
jgi:hypothetical protein